MISKVTRIINHITNIIIIMDIIIMMIIVYLMLESDKCTAGDGEFTKGCNGHGIAVHLTE